MTLTPTPVKIWAKENNVEVMEPVSLKNSDLVSNLVSRKSDLFLVASYGKIIPPEIFKIPEHKTLNLHPSLLPKYRGASPVQSQILNNEKNIGVSIMQIDEGMDTGPVVVQKKSNFNNWPLGRKELEKELAVEGARLLIYVLPEWIQGVIEPIMQNEREATYCNKIEKKDGELDIDLNDLEKNALENLLKIKAFEEWPTAYFFLKNKRIIITDAEIQNNKLEILRVKPEGKSEMLFVDFLRGIK